MCELPLGSCAPAQTHSHVCREPPPPFVDVGKARHSTPAPQRDNPAVHARVDGRRCLGKGCIVLWPNRGQHPSLPALPNVAGPGCSSMSASPLHLLLLRAKNAATSAKSKYARESTANLPAAASHTGPCPARGNISYSLHHHASLVRKKIDCKN